MSRDVGQVTTRQALAGFAVVVAVAWALVAVLELLQPSVEAPLPPTDEARLPPCEEFAALARSSPGPIPVGSAQLIECPDVYDGQHVRYTGEVVRAILRRGDRAWVQLNDDVYALDIGPLPAHRLPLGANSGIPVSLPIALADEVELVGDHNHRGARIEVVGEFRRADPEDGGGPTIQVQTGEVLDAGTRIQTTFAPWRIVIALLLLVTAGALGWTNWKRTV